MPALRVGQSQQDGLVGGQAGLRAMKSIHPRGKSLLTLLRR